MRCLTSWPPIPPTRSRCWRTRHSTATRARIYIVSDLTGFRRSELASLTPRSFADGGDPPTLTVEAAYSKHRRLDVLPLHPELIAVLPEWLAGLSPDEPLFQS